MWQRAFYFFFFSAVLLAVVWNFLASEAVKPLLMRFFLIALGVSLGCLAQQGFVSRRVQLGPGRPLIEEVENPVIFWVILLLNYSLALLLLGVGLFVGS
jgi:hypothetical protein